MVFPLPNLDDRDFQQLLAEAKLEIKNRSRDWSDLSASDPGIVLLEVFAYLTETMLYRLNRIPEKNHLAFLNLLGVTPHAPVAARVQLEFSRAGNTNHVINIPQFTRVTADRQEGETEPPLFVTLDDAVLKENNQTVVVDAVHGEWIEGELLGSSSGEAGQVFLIDQPPIVRGEVNNPAIIVGVELTSKEVSVHLPIINFKETPFRIWRESKNFANLSGDHRFSYIVDRMAGEITFAPIVRHLSSDLAEHAIPALGEIPESGREIRVWYLRGGGEQGNVPAKALTKLKDSVVGVNVTNLKRAVGGRDGEVIENAIKRGPLELHSLQRAVTARDFEMLALQASGGVNRAKAITRSAIWKHALPGTVEVLLVPQPTREMISIGSISPDQLVAIQSDEVLKQIQSDLDERRPLGTSCMVNWTRYKTVTVSGKVVVQTEENPEEIKARIIRRLNHMINPLVQEINTREQAKTWQYGESLRSSTVYDIVLSEPGVRYMEKVRLNVDHVPEGRIRFVGSDPFQENTWFATSENNIFRSSNNAVGWELVKQIPQKIQVMEISPHKAGYLAVATRTEGEKNNAYIYVSMDAGENWRKVAQTDFPINDLAWLHRSDIDLLVLATSVGLYELALDDQSQPLPVAVDKNNQGLGFCSVIAFTDARGRLSVVAAAEELKGVYISKEAGKTGTFQFLGLEKEDIRTLRVQYNKARAFLWAGLAAAGNMPGKGCFRLEISDGNDVDLNWELFGKNWDGGSCWDIEFIDSTVVAASHRGGVLRLNLDTRKPQWEDARTMDSCLPVADIANGLLQPIYSVSINPQGTILFCGCREGVYISHDAGETYQPGSSKEFEEKVTLPSTWLFCSGDHKIEVKRIDEAGNN